MSIFLRVTDGSRDRLRRLTILLAGLCRRTAALGPEAEKDFAVFYAGIARARPPLERTGRSELLSRLETTGARLERTVLDLKLLGLRPDPESVEALLFLERTLRLHAEFIARPRRAAPLAEAAANTVSALKILAPADRAARADGGNFIRNLKFCRIYSDLEKTALAADDYAQLLARTL